MSRTHITSPTTFHTAVNADVYLDIFLEFAKQADERALILGYFERDGARCHASNRALEETKVSLWDSIISNGLRQRRSSGINLLDFVVWSLHEHKPIIAHNPKRNITNETDEIRPSMLPATFANT
jgi:hypothetical protein